MVIRDCATHGGFPEVAALKRRLRNQVTLDRPSDTPNRPPVTYTPTIKELPSIKEVRSP